MLNNNNIEIVIPTELFNDIQFLSTFINPVLKGKGILVMGGNVTPEEEGQLIIIKIYELQKHKLKYLVEKELKTFSFCDIETAISFLV